VRGISWDFISGHYELVVSTNSSGLVSVLSVVRNNPLFFYGAALKANFSRWIPLNSVNADEAPCTVIRNYRVAPCVSK
jgi:hypothetical protein